MQACENTAGRLRLPIPGASVDGDGRPVPRWRGSRPASWSRQRSAEVRAVHAFKRDRRERETARSRALSGTRLLAYARAGRARPFGPVLTRGAEVRDRCLPRTPRAAGAGHDRLGPRDLLALAWLAAAALGFRSTHVAIRLVDWAELLECSPRTAGSCLRRLAAMGVVRSTPYYVAVPGGMARRESTYGLAPEVLAFFRGLGGPGTNCQAEDTDPEVSLRETNEVSPVGDERRAPEGVGRDAPRDVPAGALRRHLGGLARRLEHEAGRRLALLEGTVSTMRARAAAPVTRPAPAEVSPLVASVAAALGCSAAEAAAAVELAADHRASCTCAVCWGRRG